MASFMPMARSRGRKSKRRGGLRVARIPRGSVETVPIRGAEIETGSRADGKSLCILDTTTRAIFAPPDFLCGYTPYTHTDVYRESETERDRSGACGVFSVCWFWGDALSHGAILRSGMALGEHRPSLSASSLPA